MTDLAAKFAEFHSSNPRVYELFKRFTFEALSHHHQHLSADMILHRVRWETGVMTRDPEGWKINNNWSAFYSRMFMAEFPHHAGFFRTRTSIADAA